MNFIRYPTLADSKETFSDFVVSHVDYAPTIFDLAGLDLTYLQDTLDYVIDGNSWADAVTSNDNTDFEYRFGEIYQSRAVITTDAKYIWRATDDFDSDSYYPYNSETHQLYDLSSDGDEQVQVYNDSSYRSTLTYLQTLLASHIDDTCPTDSCETIENPDNHYSNLDVAYDPTRSPTLKPTGEPITYPTIQPTQFAVKPNIIIFNIDDFR